MQVVTKNSVTSSQARSTRAWTVAAGVLALVAGDRLLAPSVATAQQPAAVAASQPASGGGRTRRGPGGGFVGNMDFWTQERSPEEILDQYRKRYALTDAQVAQLQPELKTFAEQRNAYLREHKGELDAARAKVESLRTRARAGEQVSGQEWGEAMSAFRTFREQAPAGTLPEALTEKIRGLVSPEQIEEGEDLAREEALQAQLQRIQGQLQEVRQRREARQAGRATGAAPAAPAVPAGGGTTALGTGAVNIPVQPAAPKDPWLTLTEKFIAEYKLSDEQAASARSIASELITRRTQFRYSRQADLDKLADPGTSAEEKSDLQKQLDKGEAPLLEELQARLNRLKS